MTGTSPRFLLSALLSALLFGGCPPPATAAEDIAVAVLDFELNDLTLNLTPNPVNPEEVARTATLKPLLAEALAKKGGYRLVDIDAGSQAGANAGFGYLWDHPDVAAELGRKFGADWVVVGRNHKASFLFVYFKANLVDARTGRLVQDFTVEVKGQQQKITPKGIARMAEQVDEAIRARLGSAWPARSD
jgi:hypothetical protein